MIRTATHTLLLASLVACGSTADGKKNTKNQWTPDATEQTDPTSWTDDTSNETTAPTESTVTTTTSPDCGEFTLLAASPDHRASDIYIGDHWDKVQVESSEVVSIQLWNVDAEEWVDGTSEPGLATDWQPAETLPADTSFEVHAVDAHGCSQMATQFRTGPWEPATMADLSGKAFEVAAYGDHLLLGGDTSSAFWMQDSGPWSHVSLHQQAQNECVPTAPVQTSLDGAALAFSQFVGVHGSPEARMFLVNTEIHGLVSPEHDALDRVQVSAEVDVTELLTSSGGYLDCALLGVVGLTCSPCSDDPSYTCVPWEMQEASAPLLDLQPTRVTNDQAFANCAQ